MNLTWLDVSAAAAALAARWEGDEISGIYGIPAGGAPVAVLVAGMMERPLLEAPEPGALIVDDLVDSGVTMNRHMTPHTFHDCLYRKPHSPTYIAPDAHLVDGWVRFPWEPDNGEPTDAVIRLLQHLGEDPTRDGLKDTPRRVVHALQELTEGYGADPASILSTTFDVAHDQMIHVRDITVQSLCEHHMLPFTGTCHVAYIPTDRVVGLSKIPRVVHAYSHRLQVQERLTEQIAEAINTHLDPAGVGVTITAHHACMGLRGVREPHATMTTTALRGAFFEPQVRAEFLG